MDHTFILLVSAAWVPPLKLSKSASGLKLKYIYMFSDSVEVDLLKSVTKVISKQTLFYIELFPMIECEENVFKKTGGKHWKKDTTAS